MKTTAHELLHRIFGYEQFRGQQQAIVETVQNGGDALVLMPTGGGKSLCYQIPALLREGVGIVISPLIALMQDQVMSLREVGVRAAALNSSNSGSDNAAIERALRVGELDLVYVAPERLLMPRMLELLDDLYRDRQLALFAIDEAHCVSQWGHDFRPEYLQLSLLHERYQSVPRMALTATADERTRQEIINRLALSDARVFIASFDRPNIRYQIQTKKNSKEQLLRYLREHHQGDAGIVYCLSRRKTEEVASFLENSGIPALAYHAGMPAAQREKNQHRFIYEDGLIMVATIAFGMGIDKPDVRFVVHMDLPKSIEAYYQETGRAGRDGLPSNAMLFYGFQDLVLLKQMIEQGEASEEQKRVELHKLNLLLGLCETVDCRRQVLLQYFGEPAHERCGNCDNCLNPPPSFDGRVVAQKALSTIYRTGQRFGVAYLVDVLLGKSDDRIAQNQHDKLSVFGIGTDLDAQTWRSVFRQLVAASHVRIDHDAYGALKLNESARALLRGEQAIVFRLDEKKKAKKQREQLNALADEDQVLFNALRTLRRDLAKEQNVPPYVIFHDSTLQAMVQARPQTLAEMADISGIGQRKLDQYGADFLAVIREN